MNHVTEIQALAARGALFIANNSAGKDSQAMLLVLRQLVPAEQIVVIHAVLPGVDWEGTAEHARSFSFGLEYHEVQAGKTFFEMVDGRGMFPSPKYRQCTSDLKRDPIEKLVRRLSKERGRPIIVNCMGLRAQESAARKKKETFKFNATNSKAGREWYDWLPIHAMSTAEVFETIERAGQKPHWAYAAGMSRLSCCFCIMASEADHKTAARLNPTLYRRYVEAERRHGFTMVQGKSLEEITGIAVA